MPWLLKKIGGLLSENIAMSLKVQGTSFGSALIVVCEAFYGSDVFKITIFTRMRG